MIQNSDSWNRLKSGDLATRIKSGYMVVGPNLADGGVCTWHCDTEEDAVIMASRFAESGNYYEVLKYEFIGVAKPIKHPVEFIKPKE